MQCELGFSHDAPQLPHSDDKTVQRSRVVKFGFFTALAVLRSQGTGLIRVTRSKTCFATSPPLPKGDLGGMSIFFIFWASVVLGFRNAIEDSTMQIEPRSSLLENEGSICIVIAGSYPKSAELTLKRHAIWAIHLYAGAVKFSFQLLVVVAELHLLVGHHH